ncbi:MAG: hypothetical protein P8J33_14795, partial [Pirellulaceae bacterium]|nr:hypothetical protein [Pirellulaceae bacterium]
TESRQPRTSENLSTPNSKIVNWHLYSPRLENAQSQRSQLEPLLFPLGDWNENFLNHWTRHARHSWPDQSPLGRFDALFLNASQAVGPLATLNRILAQQKLLASGRLISNGRRVVCFTEVPLKEFPKRRIFRSHLSRWDFEPWGISIRKNVLQGRGARKVQYLSDAAENPNPLGESIFQVRINRPERNDWSQEQEWRIEGDLDLRTLRPQDAVVFVPDHQSAAALAPISRWPITILNAKTVKYSKS